MISLKKNDKIIVVIAFVIILVAGAGVAMYRPPETTTVVTTTTSGENTYDVVWTVRNGSLNTISEFAGKKTPYETVVQISEGNLKSITFNMSWTDDRTTFFGRFGLDTLYLEVITPDGQVYEESNVSAAITKDGHILLTADVDNVRPPETPIKANDIQSAQARLNEKPYYDDSWTNKDIKIKVSVHIGEIRLLKRFFDKGNTFDLKITYQYYNGVLKEDQTKNTGLDNDAPPADLWAAQEEPPYMSMIISTGCGRFV